MADAEDLKSSGPKARAGSSPALGTFRSVMREKRHRITDVFLSLLSFRYDSDK